MKINRIIWLGALSTMLAGCSLFSHRQDARTAWTDILQRCAINDLNADRTLFFGASNNVGPGSIWRDARDGGYRLRWTPADIPINVAAVMVPGTPMKCEGSVKSSSNFGAALSFTGTPVPISASLQGEFARARSIQVKAENVAWDVLREGPYEDVIRSLPGGNRVSIDLNERNMNNLLVMYRALRVLEYNAVIEFSQQDRAGFEAKFPLPQLGGQLGGGLTARWSQDGNLVISAKDIYIAGELVEYRRAGFANAQQRTAAIMVPRNAVVGRDMP
jgi:hypothetical protein